MILPRVTPLLVLPLFATVAAAQSPTAPAPPTPSQSSAAAGPSLGVEQIFDETIRSYQVALERRHLGKGDLRREDVGGRVAEAEQLMGDGRTDEAIARLVGVIDDPEFELFSDSDEGIAAVFRLGDALAVAGVFEPARAYLRRVLQARGAWSGGPAHVWQRRAVGRLVDIGNETGEFAAGTQDLQSVPTTAPEEVRGEISYMMGRAQEAAGDPDAALTSYAAVSQHCRFWAQATYLSGLIHVEHGRYREGENLFCTIADPKRSANTTPVLADEKFFVVRDLARLGLGRIAHEEGRNDDARYYYYLVPQDSDRLAEALYEAATTRYEKKDYDGARELLDELTASGLHHRYEDEAQILDAWVDLARCKFLDADRKLNAFLNRYEPVRDAIRALMANETATRRLLAAVETGGGSNVDVPGIDAGAVTAIAALIRVDPTYDRVRRRKAVLEREASGLTGALGAIGDMQRALATNGGLRPSAEQGSNDEERAKEVRDALGGLEEQLAELEVAHAPADRIAELRGQLSALEQQSASAGSAGVQATAPGSAAGADLADLLRADAGRGTDLHDRIQAARKELDDAELALARDALQRLDLRLSRLLRRARLGRIESVLGRKRALEVEVEAIRLGYLPQDALDSLDAARYLEDSEEYWPFEGDDWPDEYVGSENK